MPAYNPKYQPIVDSIKHLKSCTVNELQTHLQTKGITRYEMRHALSLLWDMEIIEVSTDRKLSLTNETKKVAMNVMEIW